MIELIITEKPSSAKKIAEALADSKPLPKKSKKITYYELTHNKNKIIVASAVGHLYALVQGDKKGWIYPVFDLKWQAAYKSSKGLDYIKDYIDIIEALAKKASQFTIACDYDVEGEVIGLNVIRFACRKKDAQRMKFSTLTKPDLLEAYETKMKHLDWGQAYAGETRHKLDWFYGINLSRALTSAVKAAGSFKVMSAGRVQGPALKILVGREKEIQNFKPEPFWQINLSGSYRNEKLEFGHVEDKIFDEKVVEQILKKVKGVKAAMINCIKKTKREQPPPCPFDLTTLQLESYTKLGLTPKETMEQAQSLYLAGLTSYPRTSSQQLDPKLGFAQILKDLSQQTAYSTLCTELLKNKSLKPNNGRKTDPAHPAIYPTGVSPKTLKPREKKIYDLIVRRFLATFAKPAIRETMEVQLNVNQEIFLTKGSRTLEKNWHLFYEPYVRLEELTLPSMKEGEEINIKEIKKIDQETKPPKRYNQSSIIKELEKHNLGTKATRAEILDRLFKRGYLEGIQITVTGLGLETIKILEKYAPTIIDEKLTADFEEDMEKIRKGQEKQEQVLSKAKTNLTKLLGDFRKKEKVIGQEILESLRTTWEIQNYVGPCRSCGEGKLMIKFGKFGQFIACDHYPNCKTTFKLPREGVVRGTSKECPSCRYPLIHLIRKGKHPGEECINQECPTKIGAGKKSEEGFETSKTCLNCGHNLVIRTSFYGKFLACPRYPQCKYVEGLAGEKKKTTQRNKDKSKIAQP